MNIDVLSRVLTFQGGQSSEEHTVNAGMRSYKLLKFNPPPSSSCSLVSPETATAVKLLQLKRLIRLPDSQTESLLSTLYTQNSTHKVAPCSLKLVINFELELYLHSGEHAEVAVRAEDHQYLYTFVNKLEFDK